MFQRARLSPATRLGCSALPTSFDVRAAQPTRPSAARSRHPKRRQHYGGQQSRHAFERTNRGGSYVRLGLLDAGIEPRSEEHTSELQSLRHLVCRLLLEKKK